MYRSHQFDICGGLREPGVVDLFRLLITNLLISLTLPAYGQLACRDYLGRASRTILTARLWGQEIPYTKLTSGEREPERLFPDAGPNDLVIGHTGGHVYFALGRIRYDGGTFHSPSAVKGGLSNGALVRFRDLPPNVTQSLLKTLSTSKGGFSITCSQDVCDVLNESGIQVRGWTNFIPSRLLKRLMVQGIRLKDGRVRKPEVYLLDRQGNLEALVATSRRWEEPYETAATAYTAAVLFIAATCLTFYSLAF